jgi:hypothetical protein
LVKSRHQARQHFDRGIDRHAVRHGLWTSDSERGTGFGTVGLLYGPSGCGKSSLVKAGLIPNLSSEVIDIYVEATPEETERRILRQLHKRIPELPTELRLAETAERIRRSEGPKVVLIVDQFEQWLYFHRVSGRGFGPNSPQLARDLIEHGEKTGIAVIILDFQKNEFSRFAALCSFAPEVVRTHATPKAAALALEIQKFADGDVKRLQRELQT